MFDTDTMTPDRGQAYTLEGFIAAMIISLAVLFALQSAVITPSTGGTPDQSQIQQETQDALIVAATANDSDYRNLSDMIRNWDGDGGFEGADGVTYDRKSSEWNETKLGAILEQRFGEDSDSYNVELRPQEDGPYERDDGPYELIKQGNPPGSAMTASYTVTLYDDQNVTGDRGGNQELQNVDNGSKTIDGMEGDNGPIYNVVEVRVIVW